MRDRIPRAAKGLMTCETQSTDGSLMDCESSCEQAFKTTGIWPALPSQCDQMAGLFFNIWPFTAMKICVTT